MTYVSAISMVRSEYGHKPLTVHRLKAHAPADPPH